MIANTPVADTGEGPGGAAALIFGPNCLKKILGRPVSPLSKDLDDRPTPPPHPLSQGLDSALHTVLFSPSGRDILCLSHVPMPVSPLPVPLGSKP